MLGVFRTLSPLDYQGNWSQRSTERPHLSDLKNPILLMNSTLVDMKAEPVAFKSLWNSVPCGLRKGLGRWSLQVFNLHYSVASLREHTDFIY